MGFPKYLYDEIKPVLLTVDDGDKRYTLNGCHNLYIKKHIMTDVDFDLYNNEFSYETIKADHKVHIFMSKIDLIRKHSFFEFIDEVTNKGNKVYIHVPLSREKEDNLSAEINGILVNCRKHNFRVIVNKDYIPFFFKHENSGNETVGWMEITYVKARKQWDDKVYYDKKDKRKRERREEKQNNG